MLKRALMSAFACLALAVPVQAQDAYVVGVSGALTGPSAGTNAPPIEGLRLYVDRLNSTGGVNGKKIQLVVLDEFGRAVEGRRQRQAAVDPGQRAAARSVEPVFDLRAGDCRDEARQCAADVDGRGVPKEVYPPADPLLFCTTAYAGGYDSRAALDFIKDNAKGPVRLGLVAMAIPLSRGEIDYAETHAKTMGMTPVDKEVIPPPTADYTPFATKLKDANANWVFSWAPWVTEVKTFEALRRLGWQDDYVTWAHIEAEAELARIKDPRLFVIGANALFQDGLPVHKEIIDEAKKSNARYPAEQLTEGWIGGHGARGGAQERRLAGRCRQDPRRDGNREGRHQGPARRTDRVEQGQPLPRPAILSRLSLGRREVGGCSGERLDGPRRQVT